MSNYSTTNTTSYASTYAAKHMSTGSWIGTMLLSCIPVVNLICLIIWAFGNNPDKADRKNWAKAQIVIAVIAIVLVVILSAAGVGILANLASMF